jgi:catechol 2,3-dioxygenase
MSSPNTTTDVASPTWARYVTAPPAYRLPAATRLGRVRLEVAGLDRSIDYYQTVLGLRLIEREGNRATLGAHGDDAVLVELREVPGATPMPRRGRLGLYHFAILLPTRGDLGRFVAHLARLGVRAGSSDHLVSEALYLNDPDGLGIEVYADRPRDSWLVQNAQLAMGIDPLDVEALVRAGGEMAWTGMPEGTVMGHVHLHVGALDQSTRFYHDSLGFDRLATIPGAEFFSSGGYHHHLGTNTWAAEAPSAKPGDARLVEWTVVLPSPDDVEAAARSLEAGGHSVARQSNGALAHDPWGTGVRLVTPSNA